MDNKAIEDIAGLPDNRKPGLFFDIAEAAAWLKNPTAAGDEPLTEMQQFKLDIARWAQELKEVGEWQEPCLKQQSNPRSHAT